MDPQDFAAQLSTVLFTVCGLLLVVVILLYLFRMWMQKRSLQAPEESHIKVLERCPISPKTRLFLIEVEGRRLVIAESSEEVRSVGDVSRFRLHPPPVASSEPSPSTTP